MQAAGSKSTLMKALPNNQVKPFKVDIRFLDGDFVVLVETKQQFKDIGFSVDSINAETNRKIGRCDRNGKAIPAGRIVELCGLIRKYAPECRIKINTVVSALNKDEIMSDFIDKIAADRWKILRMKPFQYDGFSNLDIQVSDEEFEEFVERNREKNKEKREKQEEKEAGKEVRAGAKAGTETARREIVVEPDMKASYVLIK